jgi:hypothetical protein
MGSAQDLQGRIVWEVVFYEPAVKARTAPSSTSRKPVFETRVVNMVNEKTISIRNFTPAPTALHAMSFPIDD